ncbi:MAG: DNA replication and repair protein RecF [Flavobacteriales bacterium]|nr:DNA replication and repair protein RecF [Flavobacteriales bacterium]
MYIRHLRLFQFKNHSKIDFEFESGFNCFYGKNGIGKTNVLDAIHYICNAKSYFNRSDVQNIQFHESAAYIEATLEDTDNAFSLNIGIQHDGKKTAKKNGVLIKKLADYVGFLPAVMIAPSDIFLLTGNSEERRRFMDKTIGLSDSEYLRALIKHNKLLDHRNELLKLFFASRNTDLIALEAIDHQLVPLQQLIYHKRKNFIDALLILVNEVYQKLVLKDEELFVEYSSQLSQTSALELMKNNIQNHLYAQRTLHGIHKDDLETSINNVSVKKFGSQGQIKSATIALNLAAYLYIAQVLNKKPLLLLDDIFEKIDAQRAERLLNLIATSSFGQVFITDTSEKRLNDNLHKIDTAKKFFNIEAG